MTIRVIVYVPSAIGAGFFAGVHFALGGDRVRLGRSRGCDVRLPDLSVSPHHASLERDGRGYALVDEGSTNGTRLGPLDTAESALLVAGRRYPLIGPALVRIGPFLLAVVAEPDVRGDAPHEVETATLRLATLSAGCWNASVIVRHGPQQGVRFYIEDNLLLGRSYARPCVFGRDPRSDARLYSRRTSRQHFQVERLDNALWVSDLGSSNGTWLAGVRLRPNVAACWRRGAVLLAGDNAFERSDPGNDALEEFDRKEGDAFTGAPPPGVSALEEEKVRHYATMALASDAESRPSGGDEPPEEEDDAWVTSTVRPRAPAP